MPAVLKVSKIGMRWNQTKIQGKVVHQQELTGHVSNGGRSSVAMKCTGVHKKNPCHEVKEFKHALRDF